MTQGVYEVTSCAFKVNEPVGPAALKTLPKVNIIWQGIHSSAGKVSLFSLEFSAEKAFLLHSSQSVTTAITRNLLNFKPSARQVLQALKEGICEVRPLTMQFTHTDFIAKQSLQLLRHGDLLDISFRPRNEIRCFFSSKREETHIFHC